MTNRTIAYIHGILQKEEQRSEKRYKNARQCHHAYQESGAPKEMIDNRAKAVEESRARYLAATSALGDFERHKWE